MQVFLSRDIRTCLKIHIPLLPLTNAQCQLIERIQHGFQMSLIAIGHQLVCQNGHGISREDGRVFIPESVHRQLPAPAVGFIHHIIVQEGKVMVGFNPCCLRQHSRHIILVETICEHQQKRTQALSTQIQLIVNRVIQTLRFLLVTQAGKIILEQFLQLGQCIFHKTGDKKEGCLQSSLLYHLN